MITSVEQERLSKTEFDKGYDLGYLKGYLKGYRRGYVAERNRLASYCDVVDFVPPERYDEPVERGYSMNVNYKRGVRAGFTAGFIVGQETGSDVAIEFSQPRGGYAHTC